MADEMAGYRAGEDSYFSARAADLEDIRDRVLGHLAPGANGAPIPGGSVVVATDLPLSRFLGIDWAQGGAIVLTEGSPTSHVAMLARARRVPMVVGLGAAAASMAGREALVDAASGEVVLDPTEDTRAAFAARDRRAVRGRRQVPEHAVADVLEVSCPSGEIGVLAGPITGDFVGHCGLPRRGRRLAG